MAARLAGLAGLSEPGYSGGRAERVDSFPKNQRFIFGPRLAGHALGIMELVAEAAFRERVVASQGRRTGRGEDYD